LHNRELTQTPVPELAESMISTRRPLTMRHRSDSVARQCVALAAMVCVAVAAPLAAHAQAAAPQTPAGLSVLRGFVTDGIHSQPLSSATVLVEGTPRKATTTDQGQFLIDSIPAGKHRVIVLHPLLDTLGIQMRTPPMDFDGGQTYDRELAIPTGEKLASILCSAAWLERGPGVLVGFVKDPDTSAPAAGSTVQFVYTAVDVIGRKSLTRRDAPVDSAGLYHICGLPTNTTGKVQVFQNNVSSGEVPVEIANNIGVRAFSIAHQQAAVVVKNDSGKVRRIATGSARLTGRIVDKRGRPLEGARVQLQSGNTVAISKANGEFTLDSLPSGTQALEVRKLGYAATEAAVELSASQPARTTVAMGDFVPVLDVVKVEAASSSGLAKVGYLARKRTGMGDYLDGNRINHQSMAFSDVMRGARGISVVPAGDGRNYVIQDSRNPSNGCVEFWVDNMHWTSMTPGDIDQFVRPDELVAVEVYHGSETPAEFTTPGQSACATIVAWTVARVRPDTKNGKKP